MSAVTVQVRGALAATRLSSAARWRTLRSGGGRFGAWVAAVVLLLAVNAAAGLGDLLRTLAETDPDSTAGIFAQAYLLSWVVDGFGPAAAVVAIAVLSLTVVGPLLGPPPVGLLEHSGAVGLARVRMARYADSLAASASTLTTWVSLVALTGLASLVSLDGHGRARALVCCWVLWVAMVPLSAATGWVREFTRRSGAAWPKVAAAVVAGVLAGAVLVDPAHGSTLFGAGPHLAGALTSGPLVPVVVVLAGLLVGSLVAGWVAARAALALPERTDVGRAVRVRPLPGGAVPALVVATLRALVRTRAVTVPVAGVALFATGLALVGDGSMQQVAAVAVTCSLVVPLAWSVNSLTLLGTAGSWLASLPRLGRAQLGVHVALGAAANLSVCVLPWLVAVALGRAPGSVLGVAVVTGVVASVAAGAVSAVLSVTRPVGVALEDGQPLVPAATTIAYTLLLLCTAGLGSAGVALGRQMLGDGAESGALAVTWPWALGVVVAGVVVTVLVLWRWGASPARRAMTYAALAR